MIYRDLFKNACPVALSFLLHLYCSEQSLWHFFSRPGYLDVADPCPCVSFSGYTLASERLLCTSSWMSGYFLPL